MVSAHVMQAVSFSYQISANVMETVYLFVCIRSGTNGLCVCDAGSLSIFAHQVSANVMQVAS